MNHEPEDLMPGIWQRVREKETVERFAACFMAQSGPGTLAVKLSISALCGLAMALMPLAVAAQGVVSGLL